MLVTKMLATKLLATKMLVTKLWGYQIISYQIISYQKSVHLQDSIEIKFTVPLRMYCKQMLDFNY